MTNLTWPTPEWAVQNVAEADIIWQRHCADAGYRRLHQTGWPTDETTLDRLDADFVQTWYEQGARAFAIVGDAAAHVVLEEGRLLARIAANNREAIDDAVAVLRTVLPASEPTDGKVPVMFWTYGPHGPQAFSRKVDVAPWEEVVGNYAAATRGTLARMMRHFEPSHGGQLILWQGEPGTGKTHALRALGWEWRDWAALHYIVDPDQLFGEHADYLIQVLLSSDTPDEDERWKVLVLEDTGELLAADAKDRTGQGLSRLLNTVDGLIGQGLRILVLVTTNEELKRLHPAVQRPGRCALQLTFESFTAEEASEWLAERYVPGGTARVTPPAGMTSLADLYALAEGYREARQSRAVGFAAA